MLPNEVYCLCPRYSLSFPYLLFLHTLTHTRSHIEGPASLTARQLFLHNGIFHLTTSQDGLSL